MLLGAANRDPRKWEKPDTYDTERRTTGHVGYGAGVHICVGQLLARVEGEAMLAALARRVHTIHIVGDVKRAVNNTLRGFNPCQWSSRRSQGPSPIAAPHSRRGF